MLTIIDTFTRLSPAIDVRQSYRGADVVATLERAAIETSLPKTIRVDNGPEFVSKELDLWAFIRGVVRRLLRDDEQRCAEPAYVVRGVDHAGRYVVAPGGMIEYADISVDYRDAATRPN